MRFFERTLLVLFSNDRVVIIWASHKTIRGNASCALEILTFYTSHPCRESTILSHGYVLTSFFRSEVDADVKKVLDKLLQNTFRCKEMEIVNEISFSVQRTYRILFFFQSFRSLVLYNICWFMPLVIKREIDWFALFSVSLFDCAFTFPFQFCFLHPMLFIP